MITYENQNGRKIGNRRGWAIDVRLDGKQVGEIIGLANGFAYRPKGAKRSGEVFPTIEAVKRSIEAE